MYIWCFKNKKIISDSDM